MTTQSCILSGYLKHALAELEDGSFAGRIPACTGVIAFGVSLTACQSELRSTLEDWVLLGIKLRHALPVIEGIDLNQEPVRESLDTL